MDFNREDLRLTFIRTLSFLIENINELEFVDDNINRKIQASYKYSINLENNECILTMSVVIEYADGDGEEEPIDVNAKLKTAFSFFVNNLDKHLIEKEEGNVIIEENLHNVLLRLSYSTFRGIFLEKFSDTIFDGVILPMSEYERKV